MSGEDAAYLGGGGLDPDTELGVSVTSSFEIRKIIGVLVTSILVSRSNIFSKKIVGGISYIEHIYWSKGFSVKGLPAELSTIKPA